MHTNEMKNDLYFLARGVLRDASNTWEITLELRLPFRWTKSAFLDHSTGRLYSNCYPFLLRGWLFFLRFLCDLEPSPALKPSRRCLLQAVTRDWRMLVELKSSLIFLCSMYVCVSYPTHTAPVVVDGERKYDDRELKREGSTKMHQIELFLNARRVFCSSRERSSDRQVLYAQRVYQWSQTR